MKDLVLKLVEYINWILIIMISFGLWQLNCLLLTLFHNGLNLNYVFLYLIFNFCHVNLLKHYLNMWRVFEKKNPKNRESLKALLNDYYFFLISFMTTYLHQHYLCWCRRLFSVVNILGYFRNILCFWILS